MDIVGDQFLRFLASYRRDRIQEINEFLGVVPLSIKEVETIFNFSNVDCVSVRVVFQDELL